MVVSRCSVKNWNFQAIMFDHWRCDSLRHTYVHFSCNAHAKKARKEKDGGAIGKAAWVAAMATQFWAIYTVHIFRGLHKNSVSFGTEASHFGPVLSCG